jgi:hypothetical protein
LAQEPVLPRAPLGLVAHLKDFAPPSGPFDAEGSWEHHYSIRLIHRWQGVDNLAPAGVLRLRREPMEGKTFRLHVTLAPALGSNVERVEAQTECAQDRLSTPRRWEVVTYFVDPKGRYVEDTEVRETGEFTGKAVRRHGRRTRSMGVRGPLTSNWSLFDALQRLPRETGPPLEFAMLEELRLLRLKQRLMYRESVETEIGGKPTRLHEFEQFGEGILPYRYWLDDAGRLLFAAGGLRACVIDPKGTVPEVIR